MVPLILTANGGRTLLSLSEPPFWTEPSFGLGWRRCHGKARPNSDRKGEDTFLLSVSCSLERYQSYELSRQGIA
jgi:hypothetical protein